jgi:Maltokinase N-terminal cap domain
MALVHRATLSPSKQELVETWLQTQSWTSGLGPIGKLAEYRFDDPAGQVGVETILWQTPEGAIVQTPLTYRAAPLPGAETHLIGTSDHTVLGKRWVYDGCGDPVWAATLAAAILTGGTQADMYFEQDGERIDVPPRMQVRGSGSPGTGLPDVTSIDSVTDEGTVTVVRAGDLSLRLARVVGSPLEGEYLLNGRIDESGETRVLASLRRS